MKTRNVELYLDKTSFEKGHLKVAKRVLNELPLVLEARPLEGPRKDRPNMVEHKGMVLVQFYDRESIHKDKTGPYLWLNLLKTSLIDWKNGDSGWIPGTEVKNLEQLGKEFEIHYSPGHLSILNKKTLTEYDVLPFDASLKKEELCNLLKGKNKILEL